MSDHKFALLAVQSTPISVKLPYLLDKQMEISQSQLEMTDWWKRAVGLFIEDELKDCNLILCARKASESSGILGQEDQLLKTQVVRTYRSLILAGVRTFTRPLVFSGSVVSDESNLKEYCRLPVCRFTEGFRPSVLNEDTVGRAVRICQSIELIEGRVGEFVHLRGGLYALLDGLEHSYCNERVLCFVRALEALHASSKGDNSRVFEEKCNSICESGRRDGKLFKELYLIRNNVVHMNPFEEIMFGEPDEDTAEKHIIQRSSEAELFAKELYCTILCDPILLENFATPESIRNFWKSNPSAQLAIDIEQINEQRQSDWKKKFGFPRSAQSSH